MSEKERKPRLRDGEFRALLNLYMASDPWPTTAPEQVVVSVLLDEEARVRGHENWVEAYHEHER